MGATLVNTGFLFAKAEGAIYGLTKETHHFGFEINMMGFVPQPILRLLKVPKDR